SCSPLRRRSRHREARLPPLRVRSTWCQVSLRILVSARQRLMARRRTVGTSKRHWSESHADDARETGELKVSSVPRRPSVFKLHAAVVDPTKVPTSVEETAA